MQVPDPIPPQHDRAQYEHPNPHQQRPQRNLKPPRAQIHRRRLVHEIPVT
jgi:hypothetical protein